MRLCILLPSRSPLSLSRLATLAPQGTIERLQADEYGRNRGAVVEIWNLVHVEHKNELLELGAPAHAEVA